MKRKSYWVVRKCLHNVLFYLKKFLYKILAYLEDRFGLLRFRLRIVFTMALQVCAGLLLAFLLQKTDCFLLDKYKLDSFDLGMLKDITIGSMGIAGVILGLYCANISSIFSAKYANVPRSIANLFQQDIVTKSCIRQIVGHIVFCAVVLLECILGRSLYAFSLIGLLCSTIFMVVTFSMARNRSFELSNSFSIANIPLFDLKKTIKKATKRSIFSVDKTFQNHYKKTANYNISVLSEIGQYNLSIPRNQNITMVLFMDKVLAILENYWASKKKIQFDSLWFDEKYQYKQWHFATDQEISIALETGTFIQPTVEKDTYWIEEQLLSVCQSCFEKILKDDDISMLRKYFSTLCAVSQKAGENNLGLYWLRYFKKAEGTSKQIIVKHLTNNDPVEETALSAIDILCSNYSSLIVGINQYLSELNLEDIFAICKKYSRYDQCDISRIPFLNTLACKKLYAQIEAEWSIERQRITPDWFIEQTVAAEINKTIGSIIETISTAIKSVFDIGQQLQQEGHCIAAADALSHVFEVKEKCQLSICTIDSLISSLREKYIDKTYIWEEVSTEKLKKEMGEIDRKIPGILITCSKASAKKYWNSRAQGPDFLGLCYNYISEVLIQKIENDDFNGFQDIYKDYYGLMIVYQEYVRTDVIKYNEAHLSGPVFHVATAPFFEYALISGLAILWGEFLGQKCWRDYVDNTLQELLDKDRCDQEQLQTIIQLLTYRQHGFFGIGNRDVIQTGWIQRIEHAISSSPIFEVENMQFNTVIKTNSLLLKKCCGGILLGNMLNLNSPEEAYLLTSVNKHLPDGQKYLGHWDWEE